MLIECLNCGFYVASSEKNCLDCGLNEPGAPLDYKSDDNYDQPLTVKNTLIIAAVIGIGYGIYHYGEPNFNLSELTWIIIGVILLLTLLFALFILPFITRHYSKAEERRRFAAADAPTNLRFIQETIFMRKIELTKRLPDYTGAVKRGKRLSCAIGKSRLSPENIEILNLTKRYDLLVNKIDFARLQNQLQYVIGQRNAAQNKEDFSEWIAEIIAEIKLLKASPVKNYAAEISEDFQIEQRDFLAQLAETEKSCEALLNEPNDQPFQNNFETSFSNDSINRVKSFDVRRTIANLGNRLAEAERRFAQLKINRQ